jgi:DNA-directed RNA polymerase subunit RPC12/RpoP
MYQINLEQPIKCVGCGTQITLRNSFKIKDRIYCIPCGYRKFVCPHDFQHKITIPEHSLEEYWVCIECGEILDKTDTSIY